MGPIYHRRTTPRRGSVGPAQAELSPVWAMHLAFDLNAVKQCKEGASKLYKSTLTSLSMRSPAGTATARTARRGVAYSGLSQHGFEWMQSLW